MTNIAMENHYFSWESPLFLWPFSVANCKRLPGRVAMIPMLEATLEIFRLDMKPASQGSVGAEIPRGPMVVANASKMGTSHTADERRSVSSNKKQTKNPQKARSDQL